METELVTLIVFGTAACCTLAGFVLGHVMATRKWSGAAQQAIEREKKHRFIDVREQNRVEKERLRLLELVVNLPETISRMGSARSTPALCRITVRAFVDTVGAERVGLFLAHGSPPVFQLEVYVGSSHPADELSFELGQGRLGRLAELVGVRSERDASESWTDLSAADDLFAPDLCVCIRRQDTVHAFVALDGVEDEPGNRRLIQMLADNHAVAAGGLESLHKELSEVEIDSLTGLVNRRHIERRLPEELSRAQTYDVSLSLFRFEIDDFAHFVENNGAEAGDECLEWVSTVTRKVTRGSDVVCRYGPEDFLVIFLGTGSDSAWSHADRIRDAIANTNFPHGETQPEGFLTISGGVASSPDDGTEAAQLMRRCNDAFAKAKSSGGNQVHRASQASFDGGAPLPARSPLPYPADSPNKEDSGSAMIAELRAAPFTGEPGSPDITLRGAVPIHTPLPVLKDQIPSASSRTEAATSTFQGSPPPVRFSRSSPPKSSWGGTGDSAASEKHRGRPISESRYLLTDQDDLEDDE